MKGSATPQVMEGTASKDKMGMLATMPNLKMNYGWVNIKFCLLWVWLLQVQEQLGSLGDEPGRMHNSHPSLFCWWLAVSHTDALISSTHMWITLDHFWLTEHAMGRRHRHLVWCSSLELSQCWTPQQLWSFVDRASYAWIEVVIQLVPIWKINHLVMEIK